MLKKDVKIGERYSAKVSNKRTTVQILQQITSYNGRTNWRAINLATGREITLRSAARLSPLHPIDDMILRRNRNA